MSLISLIRRNS